MDVRDDPMRPPGKGILLAAAIAGLLPLLLVVALVLWLTSKALR